MWPHSIVYRLCLGVEASRRGLLEEPYAQWPLPSICSTACEPALSSPRPREATAPPSVTPLPEAAPSAALSSSQRGNCVSCTEPRRHHNLLIATQLSLFAKREPPSPRVNRVAVGIQTPQMKICTHNCCILLSCLLSEALISPKRVLTWLTR
ncbi:hypothetical protein AAHA92_06208 [Salvia divinorum]|uniref:Uncharacterized protein n=1 Tax=Salvia divinorum TaxID=28513 RepID=A0ABD1I4Y7_SALDI